jgi:prevent-host-death family protein
LVKVDQQEATMPETVLNLYEAKSSLSRLVDRAAAGEEIIIAKAGKPMAKLTAVSRPARRRKPGGWKGRVVIAKNFDAPLPAAIRAAFEGRR